MTLCREFGPSTSFAGISMGDVDYNDGRGEEEPRLLLEHEQFSRFIGRCFGLLTNVTKVDLLLTPGSDAMVAAVIFENLPQVRELDLHLGPSIMEEGLHSLELALNNLKELRKLDVDMHYLGGVQTSLISGPSQMACHSSAKSGSERTGQIPTRTASAPCYYDQ